MRDAEACTHIHAHNTRHTRMPMCCTQAEAHHTHTSRHHTQHTSTHGTRSTNTHIAQHAGHVAATHAIARNKPRRPTDGSVGSEHHRAGMGSAGTGGEGATRSQQGGGRVRMGERRGRAGSSEFEEHHSSHVPSRAFRNRRITRHSNASHRHASAIDSITPGGPPAPPHTQTHTCDTGRRHAR